MPHLTTDDGVKLWYEETGSGTPLVFVHEFAGDARSWEPQVRHFSRRYRCVAYNARGYPPSDVPEDVERYSQARVRDDILCVLEHLKIARAHVVGLSMGSFATLHFAMAHGARALSATVAGCGYGAYPATRAAFIANAEENARGILDKGMAWFASTYGHGPARLQLKKKDEISFNEYIARLSAHSAIGSANTMRGYQARRPSLYELTAEMARIAVPVLIVNGDEDEACLEPGMLMKRTIPKSGHVVFPWTGHAMNLEEPALFNRVLEDFFHQVESGRW